VAALPSIPADVTQVALIPVGYYAGETLSPAFRPPPETVTHGDGWTEPPP
jgi:hypothetical protein